VPRAGCAGRKAPGGGAGRGFGRAAAPFPRLSASASPRVSRPRAAAPRTGGWAGVSDWWRGVRAIVRKDTLEEFRSRESLAAMGVFGLLVATLFAFAFDPQGQDLRPVFAGLLWVGFLFAGMLGMGRSFARERENGALAGLLAAPVDPSAVFYGKLLANAAFVGLAEAVLLPAFFALLQVPWPGTAALVAPLALATAGFVAVGTLMSAVVAQVRAGEVLLPLGAVPLLTPLLIAAVRLTQAALDPSAGGAPAAVWYGLLIAYDLVFLALPAVLFEYVAEV
jgi:heme exporter protein B